MSLSVPSTKSVLPLPPGLFLATPPFISLLIGQPASLVLITPLRILAVARAALLFLEASLCVASLPVPLPPVVANLLLACPSLLFP